MKFIQKISEQNLALALALTMINFICIKRLVHHEVYYNHYYYNNHYNIISRKSCKMGVSACPWTT